MKLDEREIDEALRRTWDDQQLTRGERRALARLVEEPAEMRFRVRRRSFEMARALAANKADVGKVLEWLEEVQKALTESAPPEAARSGNAEAMGSPSGHPPEAYFSPHDKVALRIAHALDATKESADLAVFTITDDRISKPLLMAHERGVKLRILSDNDKANDFGSDIERFARAGIPVRIDRTPVHMHHKFAIFDGRLLLTGSYNWTRSANDENAENIVLTYDATLVKRFMVEFERLWGLCERY